MACVPVVEPAFVLYWKVILESKKYSELFKNLKMNLISSLAKKNKFCRINVPA